MRKAKVEREEVNVQSNHLVHLFYQKLKNKQKRNCETGSLCGPASLMIKKRTKNFLLHVLMVAVLISKIKISIYLFLLAIKTKGTCSVKTKTGGSDTHPCVR